VRQYDARMPEGKEDKAFTLRERTTFDKEKLLKSQVLKKLNFFQKLFLLSKRTSKLLTRSEQSLGLFA